MSLIGCRPSLESQQGSLLLPASGLATHRAERELWRRRRAAMELHRRRSTPDGIRRDPLKPLWERSIRAFDRAVRLSGLHGRGRRNALNVRREELALPFAGLPGAFEGYRILHITDPHFDAMPGLGAAIANAVDGLDVDLCVLTGDYRTADDGLEVPAPVLEALGEIRSAVTAADGFCGVLGNHDTHAMIDPFEALGIHMLVNQTVQVNRAGHRLTVTGVDDVHRFYTPAALTALAQATPFGSGHFGLALVHSPEFAAEASAAGYSLYLCGHTHGGQVAPPGGRPILTPLSRNHRLARGLWQHGRMTGYTSRGAGVTGVPLRYYSPAEVTVVTLTRG
jgi:predicted MPP superfamily phosphohydrolase